MGAMGIDSLQAAVYGGQWHNWGLSAEPAGFALYVQAFVSSEARSGSPGQEHNLLQSAALV